MFNIMKMFRTLNENDVLFSSRGTEMTALRLWRFSMLFWLKTHIYTENRSNFNFNALARGSHLQIFFKFS